MIRYILGLLACMATAAPVVAEDLPEKSAHSPYTIGPAIRDIKHGTLVIPVYHYWRKGKGNTTYEYNMEVLIGGKPCKVVSCGNMLTESATGTMSVLVECTIRDWKVSERGESKEEPSLKTADELEVRFKGVADGTEQKLEQKIKVVDFEGPDSSRRR